MDDASKFGMTVSDGEIANSDLPQVNVDTNATMVSDCFDEDDFLDEGYEAAQVYNFDDHEELSDLLNEQLLLHDGKSNQ